jgi:CRISPR-associated protein Csb2
MLPYFPRRRTVEAIPASRSNWAERGSGGFDRRIQTRKACLRRGIANAPAAGPRRLRSRSIGTSRALAKCATPRQSIPSLVERIGLPAPTSVRLHKHAAINGAPSAWPPNGAPAWTGWARPSSLSGRKLFHTTVSFAEPVNGPIVVGAGRFFGLGLCLPIDGGDEA